MEMAVAWASLGLLAAASFGTFFYLGSKIDAINGRIDALGAQLGARIDALSARIDAHIERHAG
jgi:hypothetical protein